MWTKQHLLLEEGLLQVHSAHVRISPERVVFLDREVRVEQWEKKRFWLRFNTLVKFDEANAMKWKVGWRNIYYEANSETEASDWIKSIKEARAATTWELDDCKERLRTEILFW